VDPRKPFANNILKAAFLYVMNAAKAAVSAG
jgi:hypothetical protein